MNCSRWSWSDIFNSVNLYDRLQNPVPFTEIHVTALKALSQKQKSFTGSLL